MLAFRTGLAGGRKPASNPQFSAIPRGLVFQLPPELSHANIGNRARKVMIFHRATDVQIFQRQHIGTANQGRGGLVQEIRATGGDSGVIFYSYQS